MLVADDEPEMRHYLCERLSEHYHVIEATDGIAAVEAAKESLPDLIVLDYMMPELNGFEVCQRLRSDESTSLIPIILLTAKADQETRLELLSAGATDFLTKPFGYEELQNRCRNLLGMRQAQVLAASKQQEAEVALHQLKDAEAQLIQSEKVASLGKLSAGLLHEINNPITFSLSAVSALKKLDSAERQSSDYDEILADLSEGLGRARDILFGLKRFSHPDHESMGLVVLADVFHECETFVRYALQTHQLILEWPDDPELVIWGNQNQLVHLFLNMIQNSIDSLVEKSAQEDSSWRGCIQISTKLTTAGNRIIQVSDNGMGIDSKIADKVLDPFFTTKPVGNGVGLGLSIVHRIVLNHGGQIRVESEAGEKCIFSMEFPQNQCKLR